MLELVRRFLKRVLKVNEAPPEVPLGENPEVFRASTKHLTYLLALWALRHAAGTFAVLVSVGAGVAGLLHDDHTGWAAALAATFSVGWLIVVVCAYAAIRIDWEMRWYVLTDRSLRIREGIVLTREVTLTLANVQELKVMQGPIQRALGIMDLLVDTAGGASSPAARRGSIAGHHGVLRGVDRGGDLKEKIAKRVQQRRGTGLGDADEHEHDHDVHDGHDGAALPPAPPAADVVAALRDVRDEARRLRDAV